MIAISAPNASSSPRANPSPYVRRSLFERLLAPVRELMAKNRAVTATDQAFLEMAHRIFRAHGVVPNPVGTKNPKTGTPGTYRPISNAAGQTTCPGNCPFREDCYAQQSFVGYHQGRSNDGILESLASVAIAIVLGRRMGTVARLHISGDFGRDADSIDFDYIDGLVWLGKRFRQAWGKSPIGYTYTHWTEADLGDTILRLRDVGIFVRESDKWGPGGAVIAPHDHIPTLRKATGLDLVLCPAQLTHNSTQCADCRICWEYPEKVIVFEPHGPTRATVEESARKVMVDALT